MVSEFFAKKRKYRIKVLFLDEYRDINTGWSRDISLLSLKCFLENLITYQSVFISQNMNTSKNYTSILSYMD